MSSVLCGVCGASAAVVFRGYPGYQHPQVFDIARCARCESSFALADGVPTAPIYEAIYRQADRVPGYERYVGYAEAVAAQGDPLRFLAEKEAPYWGVRQFLLAGLVGSDARVLEVGSGLGYLTFALARAGFRVEGIDISARAVETARRRFGDMFRAVDLFGHAAAHPGEYDVVVLTEVVEHLSDPYPFLRACLALLREGGRVVISTPNRESFAPDTVWDTEAPPVHLWWFTRQSFRVIASRLGCDVWFVDLSAFPGGNAWRLLYARGDPRITRPARIDSSGNLRQHATARRSLLRRALSRAMRRVHALQESLRHRHARWQPGYRDRVSPNIVTVLTKCSGGAA